MDALVRTARDISGANLSSRLQKVVTGDELQRLADTLNEMLARMETALRITEFTADASHELRTPVSLIRTEAELALRRSRGEAEYKESLLHILLEAERTTAQIEQLLAMARADSGRGTPHMQSVDMRETLRSVVEGWKQVATIRDLQFSASISDQDSFVMGDEAVLRRLIDILLDNAFKYTPAPGTVHLALGHSTEGDDHGARLRPGNRRARTRQNIRAVLPHRQGAQPRTGRRGPGPLHRAVDRDPTSRVPHRRE